jgi:putative glutamine amidotransferase
MKKPVIGITCSMRKEDKKREFPTAYAFEYLNRPYSKAVEKAGGLPMLLPNLENLKLIENILSLTNGLLVSGGGDVSPKLYNQEAKAKLIPPIPERDEFEIGLIQKAEKKKLPILGICRGMQVINVAFGGSLYQDFKLNPVYSDHRRRGNLYLRKHEIRIEKNSLLYLIIRKNRLTVNTSHHQMIDLLSPEFEISAISVKDGVVEAIEHKAKPILGLQWHPEVMRDLSSRKIFKWLINQAMKYEQKRYFIES